MDVKGARALADRIAEARHEADSELTKAADSGGTPSASELAKFTAKVAKDQPSPA
jgi:hypothetical protein